MFHKQREQSDWVEVYGTRQYLSLGQVGIQVIYFLQPSGGESLTQVAKGRMSQQNWHHSLLQSNKASWKLNFLVKFYGWWQDLVHPCEKTAESGIKALHRKTSFQQLYWATSADTVKFIFGRSPSQNFAVGREVGTVTQPMFTASFLFWIRWESEEKPSCIHLLCHGRQRKKQGLIIHRFILVLADHEP